MYFIYGQPRPDFSVLRGKTVQLAVPGTAPVRKGATSFSADAGQNRADMPQQWQRGQP